MCQMLPGEFGSANRTAVISSRYRSLHMSHVPVFARARYLCKNSLRALRNARRGRLYRDSPNCRLIVIASVSMKLVYSLSTARKMARKSRRKPSRCFRF